MACKDLSSGSVAVAGHGPKNQLRADGCVVLTDFKGANENRRWRMVNDNVMGGRSKGSVTFKGGVLVFSGSINTNGGGFSSVRMYLGKQSMVVSRPFNCACVRLISTVNFESSWRWIRTVR